MSTPTETDRPAEVKSMLRGDSRTTRSWSVRAVPRSTRTMGSAVARVMLRLYASRHALDWRRGPAGQGELERVAADELEHPARVDVRQPRRGLAEGRKRRRPVAVDA